MKAVLNIIGKLWALPTTLLFGLPFGLLGLCLSPFRKDKRVFIRFEYNSICFYNHPLLHGDAGAVTLGNVIAFQEDGPHFKGIEIGDHEKQHTLQAEMLGIFYIPLYLIFMLKHGPLPSHPMERGPYSRPPRPW